MVKVFQTRYNNFFILIFSLLSILHHPTDFLFVLYVTPQNMCSLLRIGHHIFGAQSNCRYPPYNNQLDFSLLIFIHFRENYVYQISIM